MKVLDEKLLRHSKRCWCNAVILRFTSVIPLLKMQGRMRQERELKAEGDVMIMTAGLQQYQTVHSDNSPVSCFSSPNNEVCVLTRDHTEREK